MARGPWSNTTCLFPPHRLGSLLFWTTSASVWIMSFYGENLMCFLIRHLGCLRECKISTQLGIEPFFLAIRGSTATLGLLQGEAFRLLINSIEIALKLDLRTVLARHCDLWYTAKRKWTHFLQIILGMFSFIILKLSFNVMLVKREFREMVKLRCLCIEHMGQNSIKDTSNWRLINRAFHIGV